VLDLRRPQIVVIEPGRRHCEGVRRGGDEYDAVWVLANSAAEASIVISSRRRGKWLIPSNHPIPPPHAGQLADLLASLGPRVDRPGLDALSALLMAILSGAMRDITWQRFLTPARPGQADLRLEMLRQFKAVLDTRLDQPLTVGSLAELFHLTPNYLNSLFRRWTGETIHAYLDRRRMEAAMDLCRNSDLEVKQIAARVGFVDPLYFSRAFARCHGKSPTAARAEAQRP
jgi:AraC-like DNA-binding protein